MWGRYACVCVMSACGGARCACAEVCVSGGMRACGGGRCVCVHVGEVGWNACMLGGVCARGGCVRHPSHLPCNTDVIILVSLATGSFVLDVQLQNQEVRVASMTFRARNVRSYDVEVTELTRARDIAVHEFDVRGT